MRILHNASRRKKAGWPRSATPLPFKQGSDKSSRTRLEHGHDVAADQRLAVAVAIVEGPQAARVVRVATEPVEADVRTNRGVRAVLPVGANRDLVEAARVIGKAGGQTTRRTAGRVGRTGIGGS